MARPREFDTEQALDAAMQCFWRRGYAATSVRDLAGAMGVTGASLYNAFGDKPALFRIVLDRYLDRGVRARIARLERSLPPLDAIRAFLAEVVTRSLADRDRRGCLLVNSALEIAPHDPALGAHIGACLAEIEAFFRRAIAAARRAGALGAERGAADGAKLLLGALLGIRVLARARPERALLEGIARAAVASLRPRPTARSRPAIGHHARHRRPR